MKASDRIREQIRFLAARLKDWDLEGVSTAVVVDPAIPLDGILGPKRRVFAAMDEAGFEARLIGVGPARLLGIGWLAAASGHIDVADEVRSALVPVRTAATVGITRIVFLAPGRSCAAATRGLSAVLVEDHVNLLGLNPLVGPNDDDWGPRFPDMTHPYSVRMRDAALTVVSATAAKVAEGVAAATTVPDATDPSAEGLWRSVGANVVTRGLVPGVIAARHAGLEVAGLVVLESGPDALASLAEPLLAMVGV